jgi:hypothetical protein
MGDRIQVVAGGLVYARLSNRDLIVDWTDAMYSDDGSNAFHKMFRCPAVSVCDDLCKWGESINPAIWRGHLKSSRQQMARRFGLKTTEGLSGLSIDVRRLDYDEEVVVFAGNDDKLNSLRQSHPGRWPDLDLLTRSELIRKILTEQIILAPEVRARIDNFKAQHFTAPTVGIHIRFSDYRANLLRLLRNLNALLDREPELQVFVATDNEIVQRLMLRHYPKVITTSHWFDPRGLPVHSSNLNNARSEGAIAALTDLYLLAECDYLIVDVGSSFSFLANILSKATPDRIKLVKSHGKERGILGDRAHRITHRVSNQLLLNTGLLNWGLRAFDALVPIRRL